MKILEIEDIDDIRGKRLPKDKDWNDWGGYEGYRIKTDKKEFYILISNESNCCENYGHITSEDNLNDFIGAELKDYRCVDDADYDEIELLNKEVGEYVDVCNCAFIDFNTDRGTLQFAVYNNHNGYYGHDIRILELENNK